MSLALLVLYPVGSMMKSLAWPPRTRQGVVVYCEIGSWIPKADFSGYVSRKFIQPTGTKRAKLQSISDLASTSEVVASM